MIYKRNINSRLTKLDNEFYLVNGYDIYEINEVAARIFELCNGKNSTESIAELLNNYYKFNDKNQVLSDVECYIKELLELNLVKHKFGQDN